MCIRDRSDSLHPVGMGRFPKHAHAVDMPLHTGLSVACLLYTSTMRQYYRGGRYDFLLNSTENIDLLSKRFIVFEIDSIKENRELFPVVTIIIMEAFINKMRRLKRCV